MKTTIKLSGSILQNGRLSLILLSLFISLFSSGAPIGESLLSEETDPCETVGDTKVSIESSPSIDAGYATVSKMGNDLLVSYYDYNDWSIYNKKVDTEGVVTDMVTPSVSPRANDGSETVIYHGLENGNIVVIWYSSSSSKGLTDTYFKIVDESGSEVKSATKINTLAGSLNRFTQAEQLSNGNIVFTWATGGSNYAMRRFTSSGVVVDANQISLTSLAGLTGTSQYAYNVAANDNGRFMVFIENYSANYYGMIFENDASTPIQVGGQNSFVTGQVTSSGHGDKVTHVSTLSTGQFLLVYQVQDGGGTSTRSITYKVYNDDGSVAVNEVIRRQVYSWGYIGEPIITNDGFILTYTYNDLGYGPGLYSLPYLEYFNNSGTFIQDMSSCLPSFEGEYGEAQVFADVDGSIGVMMNDTEGSFDYNIWLLRQRDVGGPTTSEPELTTADASSLSISGATLNGEVTADGGGTVSDRGFIYGTSPDPVIGDGRSTRVDVGTGIGVISQAIDGLSSGTTYNVKAFAINEFGTSYGSIKSFTTLSKQSQEITFNVIPEKTYGDGVFSLGNVTTDQGLTVVYTADDNTIVSITGNQATLLKTGTTTITASQAGNDDTEAATPVDQTLVVNKKALTITAEDKNKEYGSADPSNSVVYAGFIAGEDATDLSGTLSFNRESGEDVGTYVITPSGLTAANYAITFEDGELSIGKKALTITAEDKNKEYGSADPSNSVVYAGFVDGEDATALSGSLSFSRESGEDVGTYVITPSGLTSTNYVITFEAGELNIGQKALTITAEDKTKEYGSADPSNSVVYAGFADGEDATALSGSLSFNRESGEDVGEYVITPSGLTSTNYAITFEVGELNIGQKALTITAEDKTKEYGSADPSNSVVYAGFADGEDATALSGSLSFNREVGEDVGVYAITPSGLTAANYAITFEAGELNIGQKALTITAEDKNKEYGSDDPSNSVAYDGFIDGEDATDLSGTLSFSRESGEDVGTYVITPSGLTSTNYAITFDDGELNIGQKALTITAEDKTKEYGSADPSNSVVYAGFADGEDATDLSGILSFSRESGEDVGTYAITPNGLTSTNYAITFDDGELNIGQKALTVNAEDKNKEYGSADPSNSVVYAGFVDGEDATALSASLSFSRESGEDVGTYVITPSGLTSTNYAITFEVGELNIGQKALTITAEDKTKEYGSADPSNSVVYAGFADGEDATDLSGILSFSRESGEDVGTYVITPSGLTSTNYAITFDDGELNIGQKALTVTAEDKNKEYGSTDPSNTVVYAGFVDGEDATALSGSLSFNRESGEGVGTYEITSSGLTSTNYAITFEAGELSIGQKALTVTAENQNKEYGSDDPSNSVAYDGFIDGEDESDLSGALSYSRESGENVGTYEITPSGLTSTNYSITFETGELSIGKKALAITAENQSKEYGSDDPINSVDYEGFIDGEDESDLSGALNFNRESGEGVGTYEITPSGLTSTNYEISFEIGELAISQKALTITAENQSKAYGSDDPLNAVVYDGFIDGEDESVLSGELTFSRESGEDVGTYDITPSGLTSTNYAISFETGVLSIGQKVLTVTAENKNKVYGSDDPSNSVAYDGFIDGEDESDLSGVLSFSRESGEGVGTYEITPSGLSSSKYEITFEVGELSIERKQLTISSPTINALKAYDGTRVAEVEIGTLENKQAGDDVSVSGEALYADEKVGTNKVITVSYAISSADAANYFAPEDYSISNGVIEQDFSPVFTSANEFTINENEEVVATLKATDENSSATLTYSLSGGSDQSLFEIVAGSGVLSFISAPDYESLQDEDGNAVYEVEVTVSDGINSTSDLVKVTISDVNDNAPVIASGQSFLVDDRAQDGSAIGTVTASDADSEQVLSGWMIKSGNEDNVFSLDAETGQLSVSDESKLDKNVKSEYTLSVEVNDGLNTSVEEMVLISLEDSEAPQAVLSVEIGTITNTAPIQVTARFSEYITGFSLRDIRPNNARATNLQRVGDNLYTFDLLPEADGVVEVILGRGSVRDASGNPSGQSNLLSFLYDATAPKPSFSSAVSDLTNESEVEVTVSFSEIIESISAESFTVTNADITDFGGDFGVYTITLAPLVDGMVVIEIEEDKVQDEAGNGNVSASFSWETDFSSPNAYQAEILADAISTLNETSVSFKIENGEQGAFFQYQFASSNGTKAVTGSGNMDEGSLTVSGVDLSGLVDGEITLTVTLTDAAGNEGESVSDRIIKDTEANIPQGFSPNGDGIDDNWIIPGIEDYPENRVTIYNRYGKKVWRIDGYDNNTRSWASTSNVAGVIGSNDLPDGTYFYILEFTNSERKSESGYVIIKK